ncbi:MAG: TIGR04255 family protein [Chloroflexi bacterium]|nr:TIGR04255 family protein [Chloroflexota bacterium]
MATQRHLKNAPVVEALIDLRVTLPSTFDVAGLALLKDTLQADYPKAAERREFEGGLEVADKRVQHTFEDKGLHGYQLRSGDDTQVAQFRRDGFTFSRLKPYTEWETVLAEARRLWELYCTKASPDVVTRIAVRYINQLSIPSPIGDLAGYLTAPPRVPPTLPQEMSNFLTRIVLRDAELDIQANIIQALQRGPKADDFNIILDIDVYKQQQNGFEDGTIWPTFDRLRELKNRIFFDSITEKTARLFE